MVKQKQTPEPLYRNHKVSADRGSSFEYDAEDQGVGLIHSEVMDPGLLSKIKGTKKELPKDKLDYIRALCKSMRNLTLEIKDMEAVVSEKKKSLNKLSMETLPELFSENNIPSITIGAEGNHPAMILENKPFYKAVLPKDENDEVKPEGLDWLEKHGHGDLIKRVFTVPLSMDNVKNAKALRSFLRKSKLQYEERRTVPWGTLTAFVREMIEKRKKAVPLEILGAMIGRIVKPKLDRDTTATRDPLRKEY